MDRKQTKQKIYCYVNETGQDTEGMLFLVSIIITDNERDILREKLKEIERSSGKRTKRRTEAGRRQQEAYIKQVINSKDFIGRIYYSYYQNTKAYIDLTILSTAKAVHDKAKKPYEATVFVDGLRRPERLYFGTGLRKLKK